MNKLIVALGALAAGVILLPDIAEAQRRGGGGGGAGFRAGGFGGGGFRSGAGGFRGGVGPVGGFRGGAIGGRPGFRYGYGYRPVPFGGRRFAYRPVYRGSYGRRYPSYGGAVAAGLIGGLAVGALSYPYYGYGYGYPYGYGYGAGYGYEDPYYDGVDGEDCEWVRRRVIDERGRAVVRRVQVCEN